MIGAHSPGNESRIVSVGGVIVTTFEDAYRSFVFDWQGTEEAYKAHLILDLGKEVSHQ